MLRFVLRRLATALPLALGVATLVFILMETAPGEPVDTLLGAGPVPDEVRERYERVFGFDKSPVQRYVGWLSGLARGDLGWSISRSRPVSEAILDALPATLLLGGTALVLHLVIGVVLGVISAARRGGTADRLLTLGSLTLYAMPAFWLGLMAILTFSHALPWFPASNMSSTSAGDWSPLRRMLDISWHLALPCAVLATASAAAMSRFVRAGLLQALGQEFVRAARARGLTGNRVLIGHALRNTLIPVINLIGLSLPILVSGSLVIEVVFSWPGMGRLTYEAIHAEDGSVVLAATLLASLFVVLGNLAADLAMAAVDPRIRLGERR